MWLLNSCSKWCEALNIFSKQVTSERLFFISIPKKKKPSKPCYFKQMTLRLHLAELSKFLHEFSRSVLCEIQKTLTTNAKIHSNGWISTWKFDVKLHVQKRWLSDGFQLHLFFSLWIYDSMRVACCIVYFYVKLFGSLLTLLKRWDRSDASGSLFRSQARWR